MVVKQLSIQTTYIQIQLGNLECMTLNIFNPLILKNIFYGFVQLKNEKTHVKWLL